MNGERLVQYMDENRQSPPPWIELNGIYETRREAKRAAETFLNSLQLRIVSTPEKKKKLRALVTIHTHRR